MQYYIVKHLCVQWKALYNYKEYRVNILPCLFDVTSWSVWSEYVLLLFIGFCKQQGKLFVFGRRVYVSVDRCRSRVELGGRVEDADSLPSTLPGIWPALSRPPRKKKPRKHTPHRNTDLTRMTKRGNSHADKQVLQMLLLTHGTVFGFRQICPQIL